jgi:hypothetical protein
MSGDVATSVTGTKSFCASYGSVAALRARGQVVEACAGREVEDTFGVVGAGVVDARAAAARGGAGFL